MDVIRRLKETDIDKINMPTLAAFIPVLEERKAEISKIERTEFKYGQGDRHYLDVYYPPAASALRTPSGKLPVLFFIYGGGYNTGARRFPEPYDLGYRALASFFAARGFLTVIPDYRLVPQATFPAASEDIRDALVWIGRHAGEVAGGATGGSARTALDPGCVFMLAHSAGATHTLVMHLYPPVRAGWVGAGVRVRGLVLCGSPWYLGRGGPTTGPVRTYFGGVEEQKARAPGGLWQALGEEEVRGFPDVLLVQAEREPDWLKEEAMERDIRDGFARVGRQLDATYIARGHNHVSVNWALNAGDAQAERWGVDVVAWLEARLH